MFLEFCIIYKRQRHSQTNTDYDLLVLCVPCEERPLVYHEKQRPLVSPRKMLICPYDKSAIIIEICFFTRWDDPLGRDLADRLLSILKHCSVHMRRRAGPLGGIPVQGYQDPSYRARQIGAAPAHCPI